MEAVLGALATCGLFVYEAAAAEMDIVLTSATTIVQGDFDVRGLTGEADNNPEVCEASPCSGADFVGKATEAQTEVAYTNGVIIDESGEAHFAAYLPVGEVIDDPWFGNGFTNPSGAEIHLVINDHGPLIPERAGEMLNTYGAGCTDESLPAPFPDTAKADGEPGPNACALVQVAIFQPDIE
ncbi:MAG: hypothetical protein H6645_08710 [Caldilineaceae bacterium]|nr:hypothetical protein [Caldilineaceae bacterium]